MRIDSAVASDLSTAMDNFSVSPETTDGASEAGETRWTNTNWSTYFGYYKSIPELAASIDAKATWTVGKGYTAFDEPTALLLSTIKGWGKDTFNTILENMIRTYHIGGDAFAEIITTEDDILANLKPLDPSTITIVADNKGLIKRYEQESKVSGKKSVKKFQPEKIFHLARNRVADEIHGVSMIPQIENIILMRNEAMADYKKVMHRNVAPLWIFHLDTDDATEIAAFKTKYDNARKDGENMYIPKGTVEPEIVSVSGNATLNPLAWIEALNQYFFQATGVPDIILGSSKSLTEASSKIAYLAFQQTIEEEQLYIEEQILAQLNIAINLTFPASLQNEMLSDKPKEEQIPQQLTPQAGQPIGVNNPNIQAERIAEPNDLTAEVQGRR